MGACKIGDLYAVKTIMDELKTNDRDFSLMINVQDENGNSPLHLAVMQGHIEITKILLKHNASFNLENKEGKTPSQIQDEKGNSLLHVAVENNHESVVEYLLENNANVNLSNHHNSAPLHISSEHGYVRITELLLSNGAKTDLRDNDGDTPLLGCALGGNVQIAKILLQKDPSAIFSINSKKNSVLHYSAKVGNLKMTRFLLSQGASKVLKNSDDKTPEQVALDNNHEEIAKVIADYFLSE